MYKIFFILQISYTAKGGAMANAKKHITSYMLKTVLFWLLCDEEALDYPMEVVQGFYEVGEGEPFQISIEEIGCGKSEEDQSNGTQENAESLNGINEEEPELPEGTAEGIERSLISISESGGKDNKDVNTRQKYESEQDSENGGKACDQAAGQALGISDNKYDQLASSDVVLSDDSLLGNTPTSNGKTDMDHVDDRDVKYNVQPTDFQEDITRAVATQSNVTKSIDCTHDIVEPNNIQLTAQPQWMTSEDIDKHIETGRMWASKILKKILDLTNDVGDSYDKGRLLPFFEVRYDTFLLNIDNKDAIGELCALLLARLSHDVFYSS